MYNPVTESIIENIPSVEDIDASRLPTLLTRVYAEILVIKSNHEDKNGIDDLKPDCDKLIKLAFTLELYMLSPKFENDISHLAYVAATSLKILGLIIDTTDDKLTVEYVPVYLSATLLFIIGDNYPEANEICNTHGFLCDEVTGQILLDNIKKVITGKIYEVSESNKEVRDNNIESYARSLLLNELNRGVLSLSSYLKGEGEYNPTFFEKVLSLSISKDKQIAFSGLFRLANLLRLAAISIIQHSTLHIQTPKGVDVSLWESWLNEYNHRHAYLWNNHIDAIIKGLLNKGISGVVTFPTGSGKSTLINLKIASCLAGGDKVLYLVPTHALESQVKQQTDELFNNRNRDTFEIGGEYTNFILDDKTNVFVMTPERCMSLLYMQDDLLEDIGLIVFDEFHIINEGSERSLSSMMTLLTLLTKDASSDFLLVSAMVSNSDEISQWISENTKRECLNLNFTWKPTTQLQGAIVYEEKDINKLRSIINHEKNTTDLKHPNKVVKSKMIISPECLFSLRAKWLTKDVRDYYLCHIVDDDVLLDINKDWRLLSNKNKVGYNISSHFASSGKKVILFVEKPDIVSSVLKYSGEVNNLPRYDASQYISECQEIFEELGGKDYSYIEDFPSVLQHHGLMFKKEKKFFEMLFKKPDGPNLLVTTPTLAQGVNLPVDVVIIAGDQRFDKNMQKQNFLEAHEILNAVGRAGRAGFHSAGTAILLSNRIITIDNNNIDKAWMHIHDDVFSKGDQCINIEDPIVGILKCLQNEDPLADRDFLLQRLASLDKEEDAIKKSFGAYIYKKTGKEDEFKQLRETISTVRDAESDKEWINNVVYKTGVDVEKVTMLSDFLYKAGVDGTALNSVNTLLSIFFDYLKVAKPYLRNKQLADIMKECLKIAVVEDIDNSDIDLLSQIVDLYIAGKTIMEINEKIPGRNNKKLSKGRNFAIHIIPRLSYQIGVFAITLFEYLKDAGVENIPDEVPNLATIVREGVNSYDMLEYKRDTDYMRVHTHLTYGKRKDR